MILLPAIDLMGGRVVRLRQGKAGDKTVYSDDPVSMAKRWESEGGDYLHLVDLDGAFTGELQNLSHVRRIAGSISIPCELGGGLRTRDTVAQALEAGISRVVIGTRAAESLDFVESLVQEFGGDRVVVGIDARNGEVSVKGWTEGSGKSALDFAREVEDAGVHTIVYTDIAADGMLTGPNFREIEKLLAATGCRVIASGGVGSAADVKQLAASEGLYGAIIGKALYDGKVSLPELKDLI